MRRVAATPDIADSTRSFERWLRGHTRLRQHELDYKHEIMAADTFSFLRATFYRWAQLAPQALPDLADAARVLAVGDLHVENYGTWRDVEGRLVWGVNDFDEAYRMPYTFDLVRLATSAGLAASEGQLGSWQPGSRAAGRGRRLAWLGRGTRGEGAGAFCVGMGAQGSRGRADPLSRPGRVGRALRGSADGGTRRLASPAPFTRLQPHRALVAPEAAGRGVAAAGDGLGGGQHPSRHAGGGQGDPGRPEGTQVRVAARRGDEDGQARACRLEGLAG